MFVDVLRARLAQALFHHSYEKSKGREIMWDLQGTCSANLAPDGLQRPQAVRKA